MTKKIKKDKKITWGDIKRVVNKMPLNLLKQEVIIWGEESGCNISGLEKLKEDYTHDGDYAVCPVSVMKDSLNESDFKDHMEEYGIMIPKNSIVIIVDGCIKHLE